MDIDNLFEEYLEAVEDTPYLITGMAILEAVQRAMNNDRMPDNLKDMIATCISNATDHHDHKSFSPENREPLNLLAQLLAVTDLHLEGIIKSKKIDGIDPTEFYGLAESLFNEDSKYADLLIKANKFHNTLKYDFTKDDIVLLVEYGIEKGVFK